MDRKTLKSRVAKLDAQATHRLLALLLLDSTVRARSLLVDAQEGSATLDRLQQANELAHTIAGYLLSEGDNARFPSDRLSELISNAEKQGLIDWPSFRTRAFAQDKRP
jgi:hypothetical protein